MVIESLEVDDSAHAFPEPSLVAGDESPALKVSVESWKEDSFQDFPSNREEADGSIGFWLLSVFPLFEDRCQDGMLPGSWHSTLSVDKVEDVLEALPALLP